MGSGRGRAWGGYPGALLSLLLVLSVCGGLVAAPVAGASYIDDEGNTVPGTERVITSDVDFSAGELANIAVVGAGAGASVELVQTLGTWTSAVIDAGSDDVDWRTISWTADEPVGTEVKFQIASDDQWGIDEDFVDETWATLVAQGWNKWVEGAATVSVQNNDLVIDATAGYANFYIAGLLASPPATFETRVKVSSGSVSAMRLVPDGWFGLSGDGAWHIVKAESTSEDVKWYVDGIFKAATTSGTVTHITITNEGGGITTIDYIKLRTPTGGPVGLWEFGLPMTQDVLLYEEDFEGKTFGDLEAQGWEHLEFYAWWTGFWEPIEGSFVQDGILTAKGAVIGGIGADGGVWCPVDWSNSVLTFNYRRNPNTPSWSGNSFRIWTGNRADYVLYVNIAETETGWHTMTLDATGPAITVDFGDTSGLGGWYSYSVPSSAAVGGISFQGCAYGPDIDDIKVIGATPTVYTTPGASISDVHDDQRYMRVRAFLSTTDTTTAPQLHSITITYNNPPTVQLVAPADGAQFVYGDAVEFSWSGSDPDGDPLSYRLQVATDEGFASPVEVGPITLTSHTYGGLGLGTYWWQVEASDGELATWSGVRSFLVREPNTPEGEDVSPSVVDSTTRTSSDTLVTFEVVEEGGETTSEPVEADAPAGGEIIGSAQDVTTTAEYSGTVEVGLRYDAPGLTVSEEQYLIRLMRKGSGWEDITTWVDTEEKYVYGETTSLSVFAAVLRTSVPVEVDVDPDTLNLKSEGLWISVYLEVPAGDEGDVLDVLTGLRLAVAGQDIGPAADAKYGFVSDPVLKDSDLDGLAEVMVKFDRGEVVRLVREAGVETPAENVPVSVSGETLWGMPIEGEGQIEKVIEPGKVSDKPHEPGPDHHSRPEAPPGRESKPELPPGQEKTPPGKGKGKE